MGTVVTIEVARPDADQAIAAAFGWFHDIETQCTRFNPKSELSQLVAQPGIPFSASAILFEAVRFALTVAEASGGAFDPTRTSAGYRDIELDPEQMTITLRRPVTLDLGAVAKGLAIDTAARELQPLEDFAIDAGGDLYLGGRNPRGEPWSVGIGHPRRERELIRTLRLSNQAVCTSGDYERGRHILDPRTGEPADLVSSATVVAPSAMLADALATAAFVLGPDHGIEFLERMGVEGLIFTPDLRCFETGWLSDVE
jgi:thiamine biosynthesis lipoprotein